jgi:flagellar basal-body rod modification protein FlgD
MAIDTVAAAARTASTGRTTTTSNSATDGANATLNYDSFLKLLIAQMKNQDPTDPVDSSEQMSQLASFSQVEQTIKTNKHLESLMQQNALSQASSMIGKTIISADGLTGGVVAYVEINSDGLMATLTDGKQVAIETGITIGNTAPATP